MIPTKRRKNAIGSSTRWVRPSGQWRLSWYEIRPSGSRLSAGGRTQGARHSGTDARAPRGRSRGPRRPRAKRSRRTRHAGGRCRARYDRRWPVIARWSRPPRAVALAACATILTRNWIWQARRRARGTGERAHLLARLTANVGAGMFVAVAYLFVASRVLPLDWAERGGPEQGSSRRRSPRASRRMMALASVLLSYAGVAAAFAAGRARAPSAFDSAARPADPGCPRCGRHRRCCGAVATPRRGGPGCLCVVMAVSATATLFVLLEPIAPRITWGARWSRPCWQRCLPCWADGPGHAGCGLRQEGAAADLP
jgi:hypothetical protein